MICETDIDGWESKEYSKYKPYSQPPKHYNWKDYCTLSEDGTKITYCHHCDIRKTGCQSYDRARYNCHKKKSKQMKLM